MKYCPKCKQTKPLTEFYERKNYRWKSERYQAYCKSCTLKRRAEWYYKQGGKLKRSEAEKIKRQNNPEFFKEKHRKWNWNAKIIALNKYGGKCACCGITEPKFLAIDHIDGNGNKHRKTLKNMTIYRWLKINNYPKGFRVLCHNCNMAIAFWKKCPHKCD